jgi:hypothetical protein
MAHLERANRDCLKVSIMYEHVRLREAIANVSFFRGTLTPAIQGRLKDIKRTRMEAYRQETRGDERHADMLESVLEKTIDTIDEIEAQYSEAGSRSVTIIRLLKRYSYPFLLLVGVVIGALLRGPATEVFSRLFHKMGWT